VVSLSDARLQQDCAERARLGKLGSGAASVRSAPADAGCQTVPDIWVIAEVTDPRTARGPGAWIAKSGRSPPWRSSPRRLALQHVSEKALQAPWR
jgi:hypothetical protein